MSEGVGTATSQGGLVDSVVSFAMSSTGAKMLMAITGLVGVGFVFGHLGGNLLLWVGKDAFNTYAATLHANPALIWGARLVLMTAIALHIWSGMRCRMHDMQARPIPYVSQATRKASFASRSMAISGIVLFAFLVLHLAHYTWQVTHPEFRTMVDGKGRHDAFQMVVAGFRSPGFAILYIVAVGLAALHLSHGIQSMFQHVGLFGRRFTPLMQRAGAAIAWVWALAFMSIPAAVLAGIIH